MDICHRPYLYILVRPNWVPIMSSCCKRFNHCSKHKPPGSHIWSLFSTIRKTKNCPNLKLSSWTLLQKLFFITGIMCFMESLVIPCTIIFQNSQDKKLPKSEIVKLNSTSKIVLHYWHNVFHGIMCHTMYHFWDFIPKRSQRLTLDLSDLERDTINDWEREEKEIYSQPIHLTTYNGCGYQYSQPGCLPVGPYITQNK